MSVRTKRRLVALGYHSAIVALASVGVHLGVHFKNEVLSQAFAWLLFMHLFTFRRIPVVRWVQEVLISNARCPRCRLIWPLVADWSCSCGYTAPRAHHVFRPCAYCGKVPALLTCERCGTSMVL
jgi:hypothetical protein